MTALIIIAAVIMLIVLLLNLPAYAHIRYYGGKPDIKVRYLWLTIYPKSEKAVKRPRKKGGKKTKESSDQTPAESSGEKSPPKAEENKAEKKAADEKTVNDGKPGKKTSEKPEKSKKVKTGKKEEEKEPLADRINTMLDDLNNKKDAVLLLWELCSGHVKKLCGKIRVDDLVIDFASANEDAADAAIGYGKLNIAVYNALATVKRFITVTVRSVTIDCLYDTPAEKSRYDGECKVKLRPASVLNAIFAIVFGYVFNMKKYSPALDLFIKK